MKHIRTQWEKAVPAWVDFVRTGKDHCRDEMNNPAMFNVLGNITGRTILDIGCGEGYNTRILAQKGSTPTGVDFSGKMIAYALQKEHETPLGIHYCSADSCALPFKGNSFDIVTCFMALQDIEFYEETVQEVSRILKNTGRFVLVIPHPCFEKKVVEGTLIGGWEYDAFKNRLYYKVDHYFDTGKYVITWNMDRLNYHFETTGFHRTLTDYCNALHNAKFLISRILEPKPTEKGVKKYGMEDNLRIPQSIVMEAVKNNTIPP
jgi:ubiquinone/menaquinone biosynthesis C-methylase UbiE